MIGDVKPLGSTPSLGVNGAWDVARLCTIARLRSEKSRPGLDMLSVFLGRGVIPYGEGGGQVHKPSLDLSGYQAVYPGDLVLNNQQAWRGSVGVSRHLGIISPAYLVFSLSDSLDPRFADWLFQSGVMVAQFVTSSKGVGDIQRDVHTPWLKNIRVPIPSREEQAAIVSFLDHADRRIRRYIRAKQKLTKLLEEQKQAIIHRAVTRGLDPSVRLKPSGVTWLGDVPEHWETWQIGHFAQVGNGSTPSRGNAAYWLGGTYPWLNSSSVNAGTITRSHQFVTDKALRECHLPRVPAGSALVAITGQGKTRGTAAVLTFEATINQHLAFITPRSRATPEYLRAFFVAAYRELRRMSDDSGSTKGALTCEVLRHFRVVLPPVDEQHTIVRWAEGATAEVESALRLAGREILFLLEYRTRLIADVVTGKLDVREAAARLPEETAEPESLDEAEALTDAEEEAADDFDAVPEEAEA